MTNRKLTMLDVKEIVRLEREMKFSQRNIAENLGYSRTAVKNISNIASGYSSDQIQSFSDSMIESVFFKPPKARKSGEYENLIKSFPVLSKELLKEHVTLNKLWDEYTNGNAEGFSRSQFCFYYKKWNESTDVSMPIIHKAGEKMFVDFAGDKLFYSNKETGEKVFVEVFVSIMPASLLTYVECFHSQKTEDWIRGTENSFYYIGGVPICVVPDNAKAVINKPCRYEPEINPQYQGFAEHYSTVISPARVRHPKDKALVENAVGNIYTSIYANLRNHSFFSLQELNQAVLEELQIFNSRKMRKYGMSRFQLFDEIEKETLRPINFIKYEYMDFVPQRTVSCNYHIELPVDKSYYSVPYRYKGLKCKVFYNNSRVDIYYKGEIIATHTRNTKKFSYTTTKEHMPVKHQYYAFCSSEILINKGAGVGECTKTIITKIIAMKPYPQQAYKSCNGIIGLARKFSTIRLEAACKRALSVGAFNYKSIESILKKGLDYDGEQQTFADLPEHSNVRGDNYFK